MRSIPIPQILSFSLSPCLPPPPSSISLLRKMKSAAVDKLLMQRSKYHEVNNGLQLTAFKGLNLPTALWVSLEVNHPQDENWGEVLQAWLPSSLPKGRELESTAKSHTAFQTQRLRGVCVATFAIYSYLHLCLYGGSCANGPEATRSPRAES